MARNKFNLVVDEILRILADDPYKTWNQQDLVVKLLENPEFKGANYLAIAVKTLVASHKVDGWFSGSQAVNIQHKSGEGNSSSQSSSSGDHSEYQEKIKELASAIDKLNRDCAQLRSEKITIAAAAEEGIKAANARADATKAQTRIVEVQVKLGAKKIKSITGVFHKEFETILDLVKMRKNVFIYGPAGCGKSYICSQVAEALKLPFYFVSCTGGMSEGTLAGRLLPVGKQGTFEYIIGEFVKAYEQGGLFLLDEMDAADPNVLLIINAALASNKMSVPNRPAKPYAQRHKDFVCVAAANTVGTGADRLYSGRNKLDAATLDRFQIGKVFMDYDPVIEEQLCPDTELREQLLKYRSKIRTHRMERIMSTRFMQDAYQMKTEAGWTMEKIEKGYFQGWREDEKNKVKMN